MSAELPPPQPGDPHIYLSTRGGIGVDHWHGRSRDGEMECRFSMKNAEDWVVSGGKDESW